MSPRAEILVEKLSRGLSKSIEVFRSVDPSMWEKPVFDDPAAWSLKDLLAHFIYSEENLLAVAQDIASGGEGFPQGIDIDEYNAKEVEKLRHYSKDELLEMLEEIRKATINWVSAQNDSDLDQVGMHPVLGPSNVETVVYSIYAHQLLHMRELAPKLRNASS